MTDNIRSKIAAWVDSEYGSCPVAGTQLLAFIDSQQAKVVALKAERDSAMKDANRVDWYEQNKDTVLHIGKRWYSRVGYGAPIRRQNSVRDAVDAAIAKAEGDAIKKGG